MIIINGDIWIEIFLNGHFKSQDIYTFYSCLNNLDHISSEEITIIYYFVYNKAKNAEMDATPP